MADNVPITAGSGTSIATDEVGGAHYQRMKVCWGAEGAANDTSAAAPFPASVKDSALPAGAATEATLAQHPTVARLGVAVAPVTTGAASAASAAITGTCVRVVATKDAHIVFGVDPTATANDTLLAAGIPEYFWITSGHKLAAIQDSEAGKVYITPVTFA